MYLFVRPFTTTYNIHTPHYKPIRPNICFFISPYSGGILTRIDKSASEYQDNVHGEIFQKCNEIAFSKMLDMQKIIKYVKKFISEADEMIFGHLFEYTT